MYSMFCGREIGRLLNWAIASWTQIHFSCSVKTLSDWCCFAGVDNYNSHLHSTKASYFRLNSLNTLGRNMWFSFSTHWTSHLFVPQVCLTLNKSKNWSLDISWCYSFLLFSPHFSFVCRDHCFQRSPCRIWAAKYRNIGCFSRQRGKLFPPFILNTLKASGQQNSCFPLPNECIWIW